MSFTEPRTLHDEFAAALGTGDVEALLAMYEQGAVQLQDDGSASTDRDARRALFQGLVSGAAMPEADQRLTLVADDLALTSTTYTFPGPGSTTTRMTTAEVSRRQPDGRWKVVIDAPAFVVDQHRPDGDVRQAP